ncbi:AMP-binding protein [Streptomyces sp. DSM 44917]|uniref:AMP-binding protein n=1 Tax=Streptomyces boetiae TaxID=3075541 RepID=A0ABU2LCN3_9ACTN|nr:AMP-binding protein [Streptomyces sp. DSM 44917]MDT0309329.1 AMP-binding protein [Streptomyces sp. DSM 44917]
MSGNQGGPAGHGPADVLSHVELLRRGDRAAGVLARLGVGHDDPVPVLLPMGLESVVATLACIRLGTQRLTLPVGNHVRFVRERIAASGARVVICADACRIDGQVYRVKVNLDRALAALPGVRAVLVVPQLAQPVPWVPGRDRWWHEEEPEEGGAAPRPYPGVMTDASPAGPDAHARRSLLDFDDPLADRAPDDTDRGWGEGPAPEAGEGDLERFLRERPPHHL